MRSYHVLIPRKSTHHCRGVDLKDESFRSCFWTYVVFFFSRECQENPSKRQTQTLRQVQSGRHHHTIDSRSLKNKSEARVVVDIVKEILNDTNLSFTTNDIGVVASFRAQVLLIRKSRDYISLMYSSQLTQYI